MDLVPWFPGARKCHACYQRINVILSLTQLWTLWGPIMTHLARQAHWCSSIMDAMEVSNHFLNGSEPHPTSWDPYMEHHQCQEPMVKVQSAREEVSNITLINGTVSNQLLRSYLYVHTLIHLSTIIRESSFCRRRWSIQRPTTHKGTENENERLWDVPS